MAGPSRPSFAFKGKAISSLDIQLRDGAYVLRLRVTPKAGRDVIAGVHGGALKIAVTDPPERGKANDGVVRLIAKTLGIAPASIQVLAGHTSRDKQIAVRGFVGTVEQLSDALLKKS